MSTTVIVTGTGTPILVPGRAGPGVHVRCGDVALQFDAGRATSLRLVEAGEHPGDLAALFVTHHHSDHMAGLVALLMDRWLDSPTGTPPLPIIAPDGPAADIAANVLDAWEPDIAVRKGHTGQPGHPSPDVRRFAASPEASPVFQARNVTVTAVAVRHEPVVPAVAYRVDTPDGAVVVSGDTAVCDEVERLAAGAAVLVHEAFRTEAARPLLSDPDGIAAYHADTVELGGLARRAEVGSVVLTHLIPPPASAAEAAAFVDDLREGGYLGEVVVAEDLTGVVV